MTTRRILVGSLAAGVPRDATTLVLDLGPDHPSRAGLLEIVVATSENTITRTRIKPGAMHRGAEKLFEVRDYRQILSLADRHDWQAPFFGELAAALAFEDLLRLEPPARATWIRTLLAEHTRILSHLGFLGWAVRNTATADDIRVAREELRGQTSALTGNRIHPMAVRIGGVAADPDRVWLADEMALMNRLTVLAERLLQAPLPGAGVGVVKAALVDSYGLSGPLARASGVPLDLRRSAPQLAYAQLSDVFDLPAEASGDAQSRFRVLATECVASAQLVSECCRGLPPGPVQVRLPKILKLPEAETYLAVEAPLGRAGFHVVSRGEKTPWRMKLRSPSFHHVAALEELLPGCRVDEVETVLASVGYVIGDLDK